MILWTSKTIPHFMFISMTRRSRPPRVTAYQRAPRTRSRSSFVGSMCLATPGVRWGLGTRKLFSSEAISTPSFRSAHETSRWDFSGENRMKNIFGDFPGLCRLVHAARNAGEPGDRGAGRHQRVHHRAQPRHEDHWGRRQVRVFHLMYVSDWCENITRRIFE